MTLPRSLVTRPKPFGWLICLGALGCSHPLPSTPTPAPDPGITVTTRWLDPDEKKLSSLGLGQPHILATDALSTGDRMTLRLRTRPFHCSLILARGHENIKGLDLFVFGEDGAVMASDTLGDPTPTLLVCPTRSLPLFVVGRVTEGAGLVVVGAEPIPFEFRQLTELRFGLNREGRRPPPSGESETLRSRLALRQRELDGRFQLERVEQVPLDAREPTWLSLSVPGETCLDLFAVPSPSLFGLQAQLFDRQGVPKGSLRFSSDAEGSLVCAQKSSSLSLALRPHAGRGELTLFISRSPWHPRGSSRVFRLDLDGSERPPPRLPSDAPNSSRLFEDFRVPGEFAQTRLRPNSGCTMLEALLSEEGQGIAMRLTSTNAMPIDEVRGAHSATLVTCLAESTLLETEVTERAGTLLLWQKDLELTNPVIGTHPRAFARLLSRLLHEPSASPNQLAQEIEPIMPSTAQQPARPRHFDVPSGSCLDLALSREDGEGWVKVAVTQSSSPKQPSMLSGVGQVQGRVCHAPGAAESTDTMDVSVLVEPPTNTVLLFARITALAADTSHEPTPNAAPVAHP